MEHEECSWTRTIRRLGAIDGGVMAPDATLGHYRVNGRSPGRRGAAPADEDDAGSAEAGGGSRPRAARAPPLEAAPLDLDKGMLRSWSAEYAPSAEMDTDSLAREIAAQPFVTFALGDLADGTRATVALTEAATKAGEPAPAGRNFIQLSTWTSARCSSSADASTPPLSSYTLYRRRATLTARCWSPGWPAMAQAARFGQQAVAEPRARGQQRLASPFGTRATCLASPSRLVRCSAHCANPHALLREQCAPTYVVFRLFDSAGSARRVVCSAPVAQAPKVSLAR